MAQFLLSSRRLPLLFALATPVALGAQVSGVRSARGIDTVANAPRPNVSALGAEARRAQGAFEQYRRANLPQLNFNRGPGGRCDETVGRFCYWYDEKEPPPPPEPERVRNRRDSLIALLDSAARLAPQDDWIVGQRVRYLIEGNRMPQAIAAAKACGGTPWWCAALRGFANHEALQYTAALAAFDSSLALMPTQQRCQWKDISLLLGDGLLSRYRANRCGTPEREAFERKIWWLARPVFSTEANDALTEHYSRSVMTRMLIDAPSTHQGGFDEDERELLVRYSWPRAWTLGGGGITGHEPMPSYPYLPNSLIFDNPMASDSLKWTTNPGPVHARYAPKYAVPLRKLEHQSGLFKRGDSATVAFAYTVESDPVLSKARKDVALVLTRGDPADTVVVRPPTPVNQAVLVARTSWGPTLISGEVVSMEARRTARARYALKPPTAAGARVTISDILLFKPYGSLPTTLEEALPHMLPSLRVRPIQKLGFYWEAYGTDPNGEQMGITLVVVRESDDPTFWQRRMQELRMWKDAAPVSISVTDVSARGATTSARAVEVDISTLKPGAYVVQLEIEVTNQYRVRAERRLEVLP